MQFRLISDNVDTQVGLRLAGITGVVVHEEHEIRSALNDAISDKNVGVILITEILVNKCRDYIYDLKLKLSHPLIVEIPDRHGNGNIKDSITKYVRDAIGIKI